MKNASLLCAVTAFLSLVIPAQTTSGDQLLAFVAAKTSYVVRQDMDGGCKASVKIANTINGTASFGGGAAYDPTNNSIWVSDGLRIRNLDMAGKTLCEFAATLTAKAWVVSGLAFNRAKRQLIQLELGPGSGSRMMNVRLYDTSKCPATPLALACRGRTITGTGVTAAGIAYDGARDLLYYSVSISGFFNAGHTIHVARLATPCTDINTGPAISVANCVARFGPAVTGLAYSDCGQKLYVTLADQTRLMQMTSPTTGRYVDLTTKNNAGKCCAPGLPSTDTFQGLAVLPGHSASTVGKSCLAAGCQSCASMSLGLVGAPVLGNPEFALVVDNAPQGSVGSFYLSAGACSSGVNVPGLCGPIYPAIGGAMPLFIGSFGLGGTTSCTGKITLKTGMPADPALCGFTVCTQWLVVCPASAGAGVTNAVQFKPAG